MLHQFTNDIAHLATGYRYALDGNPFQDGPPVAPPGFSGATKLIQAAKWGGLLICILAMMGAGAMFGINSHRGGDGQEHVQAVFKVLIGVIIVSGAVSLVGWLI